MYDNITCRYRYVTDFVMVSIKFLNIEMKETSSCCAGVRFEYNGLLSHKVTYLKYDAPSKIRNTRFITFALPCTSSSYLNSVLLDSEGGHNSILFLKFFLHVVM